MYICYADESGHCGEKLNPKQPVEVICGVISDATKLFKSQREHSALLRDLGLDELKSADAYRGRKDWSEVEPADRDELFERVFGGRRNEWRNFFYARLILQDFLG